MEQGGKPEIFIPETRKRWLEHMKGKRVIFFVVLLLLIGVAAGVYFFFTRETAPESSEESQVIVPPQENDTETNETDVAESETVAARSLSAIESRALFGDVNFQSENFRVGDIAIGGEAEFLLTEDSPEQLELTSIRGETFVEKNKQDVKLVLTWKTNKLATSDIAFSKGIGQPKKTVSETDYSLNHSMIIPGLDQASTYIYTITSKDRFGSEVTSEPYAVYTGSKTVSLFDLIADAVGQVFGWAVKK